MKRQITSTKIIDITLKEPMNYLKIQGSKLSHTSTNTIFSNLKDNSTQIILSYKAQKKGRKSYMRSCNTSSIRFMIS